MNKFIVAMFFAICSISLFGQEIDQKIINVGVADFAPCVIVKPDGRISGFEPELWQEIARRADIKYRYVPVEFVNIIGDKTSPSWLDKKEIDVGICGITITSDRLEKFDACHPHLSTGLKIVGQKVISVPYKSIGIALLGLMALVLISAHILWMLEWGENLIADTYFPGIFEAIWCVMATISTVGYGDIAPKALRSRIFMCIVMLVGIGYFCAVVSSITANNVFQKSACEYETLDQLRNTTVAVEEFTTSQDVAAKYTKFIVKVKSQQEAIDMVEAGRVDAALVDATVADSNIKNGSKIAASGLNSRQDYGFFLRKGDENRLKINKALLSIIEDGTFNEIYSRWF